MAARRRRELDLKWFFSTSGKWPLRRDSRKVITRARICITIEGVPMASKSSQSGGDRPRIDSSLPARKFSTRPIPRISNGPVKAPPTYCGLHARCIAIAAIWAALALTKDANADSIFYQFDSLSGTIDPIRYTTADGAFITGSIALTLNPSMPSQVEVELSTGFLTARTVMNVVFNDGRGTDLSGIAVIEESGTIASEFTILSNGLLVGAGSFSGTVIKGRNPFKWEYDDPNDPKSGAFVIWSSGPPPPPPRVSTLAIDLPPNTFIDGANIPLTFEIGGHATFIPEPSIVLLLGTGLASLLGYAYRRQRRQKALICQPSTSKR